ncbi:hypothetical protein ACFC5Z_02100 [Streptomyces sp. NPDC056004]|uniref:hypothetical protein n=1 Tax=Streptomyces sp. NPDC056004 TaxID=3345677 RepID=UPI0035D54E0D
MTTPMRMHEDDLDPMADHDVVTELVFSQTPDGDTGALAPRETFDWPAIEAEHTDDARAWLTAQGVRWDPDTGMVTCPAGMDTVQAAVLWDRARDEADTCVLDLIEEIRRGRPGDDGERTDGCAWVRLL